MSLLLDVVYLLLIVALAPWLAYQSLRKGKYREGYAAKLLGLVPPRMGDGPSIWLHAVSVGEVNMLVPLVAELRSRWPDCHCAISTTTATGMALARARFPSLNVFYCPLDFSWAMRRAVRRIQPDLLILAELELWPNLVLAARRSGARVAIVNGRLSERSFRGYHRLRPLVARVLSQIDPLCVQTAEYADRFRQLGAAGSTVHITGSIKFDGARTDRRHDDTTRLGRLAGISPSDRVFLAGSTQEPEETYALAAFRRWRTDFPALRLILVPRHPDRFERVAQMLAASGLPWQRRSCLEQQKHDSAARILLVDQVGELRAWWGLAELAFVGGSLGSRGGQNMIEPAAYGCALAFGPNTQNFRDVVELLRAADAAQVVRDEAELTQFVGRGLADPAWAAELGRRAQTVVQGQLGATRRTVDQLAALLAAEVRHSAPPDNGSHIAAVGRGAA